MTSAIRPNESDVLAALRSFLTLALPSDVVVVKGQPNRVAEPSANRFVVMSPPRFTRLATNLDGDGDVRFTGSIAGTVMTVTNVSFGAIAVGAQVFGTGVADNTIMQSNGSGGGGVGTYNVAPSQTVASRVLSSGAKSVEMCAEAAVQLDFHATDGTSGDLAQTVSALLRDPFGYDAFAKYAADNPSAGVVQPLHADDPRQIPFVNEAKQVEWRWVLDACLQANQVVSVPQQYADAAAVDVVSVDAAYPPA